jgi:hypothetical protein
VINSALHTLFSIFYLMLDFMGMSKPAKLTQCSLGTMQELFEYKEQKIKLPPFPGYSVNQWGIKAHNRAWIINGGNFKKGMKIIEVGGAYSTLPLYLAKKYKLEAWVGDDFGKYNSETDLWSRWGNPKKLPKINKPVKYVFRPFGIFSKEYPKNYFDVVFSVSTLEHIPKKYHINVFNDMNRCVKPGGIQLHTIDVTTILQAVIFWSITEHIPIINSFSIFESQILHWVNVIEKSGVSIDTNIPKTINLMRRSILVESPDVVFRYYPPNNKPKPYRPSASLLIKITHE